MNVRRLVDLSADERDAILDRSAKIDAAREDVRGLIEQVRDDGDAALRSLSRDFDGVHVDEIDITARSQEATHEVDDDVLDAIQDAAANIRAFHERQVRDDWREEIEGRTLGRRFRPIESIGVYVPGGRAAYPSSALMGIIPAVVAGVEHVTVTTPPAEEINPATLAAIHEAGADRVYAVGGAQAIAALAYGTETIDPVDKIVGPGNRWVTAAKAEVRETVEIDFLAGPSEILVLADGSADPEYVAADLVAQAEHDPNTGIVAVTDEEYLAEQIAVEVGRQASHRDRATIIEEALERETNGVFLAESMDDAVTFTETYAPEHLSIQAENDEALLERIHSVGSIFLGPYTPVAAGDYASGTNHILPTDGGARITGGVSVDTFVRASTVQRLDQDALEDLQPTISTLADAEGLEAHAESVNRRIDE